MTSHDEQGQVDRIVAYRPEGVNVVFLARLFSKRKEDKSQAYQSAEMIEPYYSIRNVSEQQASYYSSTTCLLGFHAFLCCC